MSALAPLFVDGIALWAPALPGWDAAASALRGEAAPAAAAPARRPAPALLAANERRRAPDGVLLALEVAAAAVADAGADAATLPSVFASAHGELAVTDAMCRTLADNPLLLSPTRFHHSVHNAASGYWAIAAGCHAASTALAAGPYSVAQGLLEAAALALADDGPVLWVAGDSEACGPLASVNASRGLLAAALVLAPRPGPRSRWTVALDLVPGSAPPTPAASAAAQALQANAAAPLLPLFEALAGAGRGERLLAAGPGLGLRVLLSPHAPARA
ncbi:MAG: beta-ketoacyl synthase chain length factor [Rubrivivax sp.]|nr:beta-ketoacyl synthase chain length factor [Rubrivivax sp.]